MTSFESRNDKDSAGRGLQPKAVGFGNGGIGGSHGEVADRVPIEITPREGLSEVGQAQRDFVRRDVGVAASKAVGQLEILSVVLIQAALGAVDHQSEEHTSELQSH